MTTATLDVAGALRRAREDSGLSDFGDERFVEGLEVYLNALDREANLGADGWATLGMDVNNLLVNRLRLEDDVKKHPEMLDDPIRSPLMITGFPRTGTTKLHQMLAMDPGVQKIPYYKIVNPAPLGPTPQGTEDPRIQVASDAVAYVTQHFPEVMAAHAPSPLEPEEEVFIQRMCFESTANGFFDHVPSYLEWVSDRSMTPAYEYLHRIVQYLQWQNGGSQHGPWALKSALHMRYIEAMNAAFPDLTIVHCHRDPAVAIPSALRLFEVFWSHRGSRADVADVARYTDVWAVDIKENLAQRDRLGDKVHVVDVQYTDVLRNPIAVIEKIYQAWDRELTPGARQEMLGWENQSPQHRYGKHTYSLARYGLTADSIAEKFADYLARIDIEREDKTEWHP